MSTKKTIAIASIAIVAFVLGSVIYVAAAIGSEASKGKDALEAAVSHHMPVSDIEARLSELGFKCEQSADGATLSAKGASHTAVVYHTWLTVKVNEDANRLTTGYHLDRESSWF